MSSTVINTDISRELNIIARKGDTFMLLLQVLDSSNALFDISNYRAKMSILKGRSPRPMLTLYGGEPDQVNLISLGDGFVQIEVPAEQTHHWVSGTCKYDLQLTSPSGQGLTERTTTWLRGTFTINPDITL